MTPFGKPVMATAASHSSTPQAVVPDAVPDVRRSPIKLLFTGVALLAAIVVATYFLFPYGRFKPGLESELGRIFQVPVAISGVGPRLLPSPALVLSGVRIGSDSDGAIDEIRIASISGFLGGSADVERLQMAGGRISADVVRALPMFGAPANSGAPKTRLHKISVERLAVNAGPLRIGDLKGEITLGADGRAENVALQTVDRSLRISLQATPQGPLVMFEGLAWRPSDDFPLTFDSLQAKGLLQKGNLIVQQFEANAMGGSVQGSWLIDWSSGLAMAGEAGFERLDARRVTSLFVPSLALEGLLTGNLRLRGAGADSARMWANAEAQADITIMRGLLNGVDLGEAARRGPGSTVRAGSTKFERMTLKLSVDPRQVTGRDIAMSAGLFNASGSFAANRERVVEGSMLVNMHTSVSSLTLPVRVSGTLPSLQATASR
jgi:uncharacterized protein involved in outer membrane biogenesis